MVTDVRSAAAALRSCVCALRSCRPLRRRFLTVIVNSDAVLPWGRGARSRWLRPLRAAVVLPALLWAPGASAQEVPVREEATPGPRPRWIHPEAPVRVVQYQGDDDLSIVRVPAMTEEGVAIRAGDVRCAGRVLPYRVLSVPYAGESAVLVDALATSSRAPIICYGFTNGPPDVGQAALRDAQPIATALYRVESQDPPTDWEAMRFMGRQLERPMGTFRAARFESIRLLGGSGREQAQHPRHRRVLARMSALLQVTTPGIYRFAVVGERAAFLWVEGTPAAGCQASSGGQGPPVLGDAIELAAGLHRIDLEAISQYSLSLTLMWQRPGEDAPVVVPEDAIVCAPSASDSRRVEWRDRVLHPAASVTAAHPYGFLDVERTFMPVSLVNRTAEWLGAEVACSWWQGERLLGEGERLSAVLWGSAPMEVALSVRSELGYMAAVTNRIALREAWTDEYRVAATLEDVPAIGYAGDRIRPEIWVQGTCPPKVLLEVTVTQHEAAGPVREETFPLRMERDWGRVQLPERTVQSLSRLEWRVAHAGVVLTAGSLQVVGPPFDRVPDRAAGAALFDGATQLLLVPRRVSLSEGGRAYRRTRYSVPAGVVCLDACLLSADEDPGASGSYLTVLKDRLRSLGVDPERIVTQRPGELGTQGVGAPLRPLSALVTPLGGHVDADVAVLAFGRDAFLRREEPAQFERRAAALTAVLTEALGVRVVWVTPPPYVDAARMRPYAEAIHRVADAYATDVADLYTAIQGHARPERLVEALRLTDEGQALAGAVICRAVLNGDVVRERW